MYKIIEATYNQSIIFLKIQGDGEPFRLAVAKEFSAGLNLEKGMTFDEDVLGNLTERAQLTHAVMKALDAVSYSNMSRKSLVTKLRTKYKIEKDLAETAADYTVSHGYIDEVSQAAREADIMVRTKARGKRRIVADLASKGYSREAVDKAVEELDERLIYTALVAALRKKVKAKPEDKKEYMKIASWALRQGHSKGDIDRALGRVIDELEDFGE